MEIQLWTLDWSAIAAFIAAFVALLSSYFSYRSSKSANVIANKNISMQAEIEIIRFREKWIAELREALLDYQTICMATETTDETSEKMRRASNRIVFLLNRKDKDYEELGRVMNLMSQDYFNQDWNLNNKAQFTLLSQNILKREWERLKEDMRKYDVKNK